DLLDVRPIDKREEPLNGECSVAEGEDPDCRRCAVCTHRPSLQARQRLSTEAGDDLVEPGIDRVPGRDLAGWRIVGRRRLAESHPAGVECRHARYALTFVAVGVERAEVVAIAPPMRAVLAFGARLGWGSGRVDPTRRQDAAAVPHTAA